MQILASEITEHLKGASMIRKMFEAGLELKAKYGEDAVCDFSLGNPDLPAPPAVGLALSDLAADADKPFTFGYMPNSGYPFARKALADYLSGEQGIAIDADDLIITCGAAGGLNAMFRAVLEPGDEVICPSPYFVEYGFYVGNHGGSLRPVPARPGTFELDINAIGDAITAKTRAVLINSPHNPTGVVYTREQLTELAALLTKKTEEYGRPIFLIADEPYRFLAFDGVEVPSILPLYPYAVTISSVSKNLSLAGERVGYVVPSPNMPELREFIGAITLTNRILGFVNAPAIGQVLMAKAIGSQVNVTVYAERRKAMTRVLDDAGYNFVMPKGAFYFFPEAPGGDDKAFCAALQEERILAVPGSCFGCPGHFRLTFCVGEEVIRRSAEGFKKVYDRFAK